ncbi:multiple epidermal growth factor-like domains 10 [Elysia marginata]|uniref:Multiple epidermal growth factor-like domains 10 n=1 Tax=Elysia marginata TaxID=1093978 RepID=A0AAV4JCV7_9GAST|nr:multiple epidermal growth factor-like domains 10 [Elysia marginata]
MNFKILLWRKVSVMCDSVTGPCDHGCEPGYQGSFCSEVCPRGRYGPGCNQTCSVQCAGHGNPCHYVDGSCYLGCVHDDQSIICRKGFSCDSDELIQNTWAIAATVVAVVVTGAAAIVIGLLVWRLHRNKFHTASNNATGREIELRPRCNVPVASRERRDEQETSINRRSVQGHEPAEIGTQNVHLYDKEGDHYASPADIMQELKAYEIPNSPTVTAKTGSLIQDWNKRERKCHVDTEQECGPYEVPIAQSEYVNSDPPTAGQNQTEPTSKLSESTEKCGNGLSHTLSVMMQY